MIFETLVQQIVKGIKIKKIKRAGKYFKLTLSKPFWTSLIAPELDKVHISFEKEECEIKIEITESTSDLGANTISTKKIFQLADPQFTKKANRFISKVADCYFSH